MWPSPFHAGKRIGSSMQTVRNVKNLVKMTEDSILSADRSMKYRSFVNLLQRNFLLRGELLARFKLRCSLNDLTIKCAQLDQHITELRLHRFELAPQLAPLSNRTPNAVVSRSISSLNLSASASAHNTDSSTPGRFFFI